MEPQQPTNTTSPSEGVLQQPVVMQPEAKKSSRKKIFLILGSLFLVLLLCVCGVGGYFIIRTNQIKDVVKAAREANNGLADESSKLVVATKKFNSTNSSDVKAYKEDLAAIKSSLNAIDPKIQSLKTAGEKLNYPEVKDFQNSVNDYAKSLNTLSNETRNLINFADKMTSDLEKVENTTKKLSSMTFTDRAKVLRDLDAMIKDLNDVKSNFDPAKYSDELEKELMGVMYDTVRWTSDALTSYKTGIQTDDVNLIYSAARTLTSKLEGIKDRGDKVTKKYTDKFDKLEKDASKAGDKAKAEYDKLPDIYKLK